MKSHYSSTGNPTQSAPQEEAMREDPDLQSFREELRRAKLSRTRSFDRSNSVNVGRSDFDEDAMSVNLDKQDHRKWVPNYREPKFLIRVLDLIASCITFACASKGVQVSAGELPWFDYLIISFAIAFALDIMFLSAYFFEKAGWEWCFDPLRKKMPLGELVSTVLWSIALTVAAFLFAFYYPQLFDILPEEGIHVPQVRAAMAFSFACPVLWVISAFLAYRRYERHRALVSYTAANS